MSNSEKHETGRSDVGEHALRMIDKLLAERPDRVGHDFSEATRCLSAYRDARIAVWRRTGDPADRQSLEQVNAVLSVIVGGHFPLGEVPWPEIEAARNMFAGVLEKESAAATA